MLHNSKLSRYAVYISPTCTSVSEIVTGLVLVADVAKTAISNFSSKPSTLYQL